MTSTPPDLTNKQKIKIRSIVVSTPKKDWYCRSIYSSTYKKQSSKYWSTYCSMLYLYAERSYL